MKFSLSIAFVLIFATGFCVGGDEGGIWGKYKGRMEKVLQFIKEQTGDEWKPETLRGFIGKAIEKSTLCFEEVLKNFGGRIKQMTQEIDENIKEAVATDQPPIERGDGDSQPPEGESGKNELMTAVTSMGFDQLMKKIKDALSTANIKNDFGEIAAKIEEATGKFVECFKTALKEEMPDQYEKLMKVWEDSKDRK